MIIFLILCLVSSFNLKESIVGEWGVSDRSGGVAFTFEFHKKANLITGSLWSNELIPEKQYDPDNMLMCTFGINFTSGNEGIMFRSCPIIAEPESMLTFSEKNGIISIVQFEPNIIYFVSFANNSYGTITFDKTSLDFFRVKLYSIPLWKQYFSYIVIGMFLLLVFQAVSFIRINAQEAKRLAARKSAQMSFEKRLTDKGKQNNKKSIKKDDRKDDDTRRKTD